jgi:hypothetical protein
VVQGSLGAWSKADDLFSYSVLFEDPDGTRLEINYVPGKGLLIPGTQIGGGYADGTQNG